MSDAPEFVDTAEPDEALEALLAAEDVVSPALLGADAGDVYVIPGGWHRADLDDMPERGMEVTSIQYPANDPSAVVVYPRLRVEVAMVSKNGATVWGALLDYGGGAVDIPPRPDVIIGRRAIYWRPYQEA